VAEGLAYPCGLVRGTGGMLLASEAWRHRLLRLDGGAVEPVLADLPAYPGRITAAADGGYWIALFAPRNQLVEFVLREHRYRERMLERIDPAFWIAPLAAERRQLPRAHPGRGPQEAQYHEALGADLVLWPPPRLRCCRPAFGQLPQPGRRPRPWRHLDLRDRSPAVGRGQGIGG